MGSEDLTLALIMTLKDEASHGLQNIRGSFGGLGVAAAAAGTAVIGTAAALTKLAIDAIPLQGIKSAFDGVAGSGSDMLNKLRGASSGMVKDIDLMKSYNQAAMLVSKDFANTLPDAMQYLQKVSAATGTSMDYMMESLVRGIGRLSPMILDNLGIQVTLESATERAVAMFGKEKEALSKTEIQAGMTAVVMEKLQANTASMPGVAGKAGQQLASFSTIVANLKDNIGLALLPVLEAFLTPLNVIVSNIGPKLLDWTTSLAAYLSNNLVPSIYEAGVSFMKVFGQVLEIVGVVRTALEMLFTGTVADFPWEDILPYGLAELFRGALMEIESFVSVGLGGLLQAAGEVFALLTGGGHWSELREGLEAAFGPEIAGVIVQFARTFSDVINEVLGFGRELMYWFATEGTETVRQWLANAEGIWNALRDVVVGVLREVIPWLRVELSAALQAARSQFNWLVEFVREVMPRVQNIIRDALRNIQQWWQDHGQQVLRAVSAAFEFIRTAVDTAMRIVGGLIKAVLSAIEGDWTGTWEEVKKVLSTVWAAIPKLISSAFTVVKNLFAAVIPTLFEAWKNLWTSAQKAVEKAKEDIKAAVVKLCSDAASAVEKKAEDFVKAGGALIEGAIAGIKEKASTLVEAAKGVLGQAVEGVKKFLGISSPSTVFQEFGRALMDGLALGIDESKLAPAQAITAALADLLGNVRSVMEMMSTDLPEQKLNIGATLERLLGISMEVGAWAAGTWEKNRAFVEWFVGDVTTFLEGWNNSMRSVADLFSTSRMIMEACSIEYEAAKLNVKGFLNGVLDITREIASFVNEKWKTYQGYFEWFGKDIAPFLAKWTESLNPVRDLLTVGQAILGIAADELSIVKLNVKGFLLNLQLLMSVVRDYVEDWGAEEFVDAFTKNVTPVLAKWAESIYPLSSLMSTAKGILDICAGELQQVNLKVKGFFLNLQLLMAAIRDHVAVWDPSDLIGEWEKGVTPVLSRWLEAIAPLQPLLSTARGILDIAAIEVKEVKMSVSGFFDNLFQILREVENYVSGENGAALQKMVKQFTLKDGGINEVVVALVEAVQPLQSLLGTARGVLESASTEVKDVKMSVEKFFDNLLGVLTSVEAYVSGENGLSLRNMALQFTAKDVGVNETINIIAEAAKPLQPLLSTVSGILSTAAKEAGEVKLSIKVFFDNLASVMTEIQTYVGSEGGAGLSALAASFVDINPVLEKWSEAVKPIQPLLSAVSGVLSLTGKTVDEVKLNINSFFSNVVLIMKDVQAYVEDNAGLQPLIDGFTKNVTPVLEAWGEAIKPLQPLLSTAKGILSGSVEEAKLCAGYVKGVLEQLVRMMKDVALYVLNNEGYITGLVDLFLDVINPVFVAWNEALGPLRDMLKTSAELLGGALTTAMNAVLNVNWLLDRMLQMQQSGSDWLKGHPTFTKDLKAFAGILRDAVAGLFADLSDVKTNIGDLVTVLRTTQTDTDTAMDGLGTFIAAWGKIATMPGVDGGFFTSLAVGLGSLVAAIGNAINSVRPHVEEAVRLVVDSIKSLVRSLVDGKAMAYGKAYDLGYSIGLGIKTGLLDMKEEVLGAADNLVVSIVSRIKEGLGIASPSKVMERLGRQSAEGYAMGLTEREGGTAFLSEAMSLLSGGAASQRPLVLHFAYSPVMSLASESEARERIAPILADMLRERR